MSNQVFEIVQAMSGQGNCITIPGPYLDFFAGDRQQHLLAAILNQLVFWSGKSSLDDGWFYKEHAALAKEVRAKDGDVVRKETAYKPNGNDAKTESKQVSESNGIGSQAECIRPKSRMETAHEPNPGIGSQAESYLYTDLKNRSLHTDHKNHAGEISPVDNFSESTQKTVIPEAVIPDATEASNLATDDDFDLATWFWSTIIELYERAAEFDGTLAKPREPNFAAWAQEICMLRQEHGCSHDQIRTMIERIQRDQFWCSRVQSVKTLRSKWQELALKLCPANLATGSSFGVSSKLDTDIPKGFRG